MVTTFGIVVTVVYFLAVIAIAIWYMIEQKWKREDHRMDMEKKKMEIIQDEQRFLHTKGVGLRPEDNQQILIEGEDNERRL